MDRAEREAAVDWFTERMKDKLREPRNEAKGGWRADGLWTLLRRFEDESAELWDEVCEDDAYNIGNVEAIISEAVDVANFAMMIADRARQLKG